MKAGVSPLAGAILCGGLSRRMGRDKAGIDIDGTTLLERAVERLRTVADPLLLATGSRGHRHHHCVSVSDAAADRGPLGGLVAVLGTSPHQLCAVVAVDMPDLEPELLQRLAALWDGDDAVVPVSARGAEPLHAVYARSALAEAEAALQRGDLSLRRLLDSLRVRRIDAAHLVGSRAAARFAVNLNVPADVMAWHRGEAARRPRRPH
jgi:molybdenum cofactor guanylyltransferase